jgi:nitrogen PTS system EIIA component
MVLTLQEVSQRIRIPVETLRRWVLQGKIPMHMSQGEYTIRLEMFERWAAEHMLKIHAPCSTADMDCTEPLFDGILPAMQRGGVFYDLAGDTKSEVLQAAVARLPNIPPSERERVYEKLIERERLATTGIGHGIALPHPRSNPLITMAMPQISTCYLTRPIAFDAIDHQPVTVLMVLLSVTTRLHLTIMSKLSYHLRDSAFRHFLLSVPQPGALLGRMAELESNPL